MNILFRSSDCGICMVTSSIVSLWCPYLSLYATKALSSGVRKEAVSGKSCMTKYAPTATTTVAKPSSMKLHMN